MTLSRLAAWTLLAAAGFALINRAASAQDSPIPVQSGEALDAMVTYKDSASRGIPTAELPAARKQFLRFAKYYGDVVQHPLVYKHLQDPSTKDPGGRTIPTFEGQGESVFTQLNRFVVEPTPRSGITKDRGDYIREFGAAFDTVLKPIINENPEKIVRINATRILAAVCKSGATAFYPTVTELLKTRTPPPTSSTTPWLRPGISWRLMTCMTTGAGATATAGRTCSPRGPVTRSWRNWSLQSRSSSKIQRRS